MKQHPILFNEEMVKTILKGTKKQTRRIVKAKKRECKNPNEVAYDEWFNKGYVSCPYGKVGDVLWVREPYKYLGETEDQEICIRFKDGEDHLFLPNLDREEYWANRLEKLFSIMDKKEAIIVDEENERYTWKGENVPFKPCIHMPKDAARIWLEITEVRVEKLQSISEEDSINEGISVVFDTILQKNTYKNYLPNHPKNWPTPYHSFQSLWESINGSDSWEIDPWVWVLEFKQVSNPNN